LKKLFKTNFFEKKILEGKLVDQGKDNYELSEFVEFRTKPRIHK